jgi:signal transduction histidine kinase
MPEPTSRQARLERMQRLLEISRTLASTHDLPVLLQTIVDEAVELTQSEAASIMLYEPSKGELRFEAVHGPRRQKLLEVSVPLKGSIAGWIFHHARPMVLHEASEDPRVYRAVDQTLRFETRSLLGVPLLLKQEPIGVVEAINKREQAHYTEDDLAILETLAAQAAVAIDNTRLLSQLQTVNTELTRLDRMKSDFIAIASHELRTPLGLILGHATFLKEAVPPEYAEQMEVIIRSSMRLKTIIEDLSTIAHKDEGQSRVRREPFSLAHLVVEVVDRFHATAAEKQIELGYDIPEDDPLMVEGDREKIDVVVTNLVRNALTFTDPGGQIGVKAEGEGGNAKVFVVDTGIGIPTSEIEHIFDRFYQVESHLTRRHGGMGLGLSIAKAMVELHHGQIWCESKEGTGSLFCFALPQRAREASPASKVFIDS